MDLSERLYERLVERSPEPECELAPEACRNIPGNGMRQVVASALQSTGDETVKASTVLPWLLVTLGAPTALAGLLVPIRESGSMLPQAMLTPRILQFRHRKHALVIGSAVQAAAVLAMAVTAAVGHGLAAGIVIITALALFSLGRALTSIASKDVLGRTIPQGERGQINGLATTVSGMVAMTIGLTVRFLVGEDLQPWHLALLIGSGSVMWLVAAFVQRGLAEPEHEPTPSEERLETNPWFRSMTDLLRTDKDFRSFVVARSLLLVSALSPPFVVVLSIERGASSLSGLGGYVIASGFASLLGGRLFGRWADRSSRGLMSFGAGLSSVVVLLTILLVLVPFSANQRWTDLFFVFVYFLLTLVHTGVRVGRKTYVVDMAEGDTRTLYVAVSNSAMGLILLVVGAFTSALAAFGVLWALFALALLGLLGVAASLRLPKVSTSS